MNKGYDDMWPVMDFEEIELRRRLQEIEREKRKESLRRQIERAEYRFPWREIPASMVFAPNDFPEVYEVS